MTESDQKWKESVKLKPVFVQLQFYNYGDAKLMWGELVKQSAATARIGPAEMCQTSTLYTFRYSMIVGRMAGCVVDSS